jgi:hypothetical protein
MEMTAAVKKGLEAGEKADTENWRPSTNGSNQALPLMHVGTQQFTTSDEELEYLVRHSCLAKLHHLSP